MRVPLQSGERGSLLLEVLIAIALFLAVSTIIAQALFAGFSGGKTSQEKSAITGIATEQISMARALADEHWENIGGLNRTASYYIESSSSQFVIKEGIKTGVADGFPYTLSLKIQDAAREVATSTTAFSLDPQMATRSDAGTILLTCTATGTSVEPIVVTSVLTRWRNIVCGQKAWMSSTSAQAVPCEAENINVGTKSNIETGAQLKLCTGC